MLIEPATTDEPVKIKPLSTQRGREWVAERSNDRVSYFVININPIWQPNNFRSRSL
jgi:hypothetical protein